MDLSGNATTYNGKSWRKPVTIDRGPQLPAPDRASAHSSTEPGVAIWSVSCGSSSFCVAVDKNGRELTYNGKAWSKPKTLDRTGFFTSVSCPSKSFCVALDDSQSWIYNGKTWRRRSGTVAEWVSCRSSSFCVAVGSGGGGTPIYDAQTFNGTRWSQPVSIDPNGGGLDAVSCVTHKFCVAVDAFGGTTTFNGQSWSQPAMIDPDVLTEDHPDGSRTGIGGLESISCPSVKFCAAVDNNQNELTYNGRSWSAPTPLAKR